MKKLMVIVVLFLMVCVAAQTASAEKKLTYIFNFSSNILDPAVDKRYIPLRAGILETLVRVDNDTLKIMPWLAESWKSDDGVNWEFKIRDGVKFSDGSPLDAHAVKASIDKLIKVNKGLKNTLGIVSMEAAGQVLKMKTADVHPGLPSDFGHPQTAIIKADCPNPDTAPIGTGPYVVESFKPYAQIELVKNKYYWDGQVKLDKADFVMNEDANARLMALQSGQADIIFKPAAESIQAVVISPNLKVDAVEGIRVHNIIYNTTRKLTGNAEFRKGLDALINRQEIVDAIMLKLGDPAKGPFVEKFIFAPKYSAHPFGLDKALAHFKAAGMKIDNKRVYNPDGSPVKLTFISYTSQPEFPAITQVIQAYAMQLGIELEIQLVDNIDNWLASNIDWDLTMYSVFAVPRGDAGYYLNAFIKPGSPYNYGRISDPKMAELIKKFNTEVVLAQRVEYAKQAAKLIDDENYVSYICYPRIVSAFNDKVVGWVTSKMEYYMLTKDLDLK